MPTISTPQLDALIAANPDLVDRIFDYLIATHPEIAALQLDATRRAVREEFKGEKVWIPARTAGERSRRAQEVLSLFNGGNATEIARTLGIGRTTVYRYLKQAGYRIASRPTFSGNGTAESVPSAGSGPSAQVQTTSSKQD